MSFDLIRAEDVNKIKLKKTSVSKRDLSSKVAILDYLRRTDEYFHSLYDITENVPYTKTTVYKRITELVEEGKVEIVKIRGSNKNYYTIKKEKEE